MTPDPKPTPQERADELDVAAKIAYDKADFVFAKQLADHAHLLRMTEKQEVRDASITRGA